MDESSMQLIGEVHEPIPAAPGHPVLMDDEYVRKGVANIFIEVEPLGGRRKVKITATRKRIDWALFTREMLEDWDEFLEAVNDLIATLDNEELNDQLFNGDGTGNNLSGIKVNSVEFDANGIEEANANIYDAIKVTITQILVNGLN